MARRIFKSAITGMALAIAAGILAYTLAPFHDALSVQVYAAPGMIFLPLFPSNLVYWLDSDGGPGVGVFLLLVGATSAWTIAFGAAHFGWYSL